MMRTHSAHKQRMTLFTPARTRTSRIQSYIQTRSHMHTCSCSQCCLGYCRSPCLKTKNLSQQWNGEIKTVRKYICWHSLSCSLNQIVYVVCLDFNDYSITRWTLPTRTDYMQTMARNIFACARVCVCGSASLHRNDCSWVSEPIFIQIMVHTNAHTRVEVRKKSTK